MAAWTQAERAAFDDVVLTAVRRHSKGVEFRNLCREVGATSNVRIAKFWDWMSDPRRVDQALQRLRKRGLVHYYSPGVGWRPGFGPTEALGRGTRNLCAYEAAITSGRGPDAHTIFQRMTPAEQCACQDLWPTRFGEQFKVFRRDASWHPKPRHKEDEVRYYHWPSIEKTAMSACGRQVLLTEMPHVAGAVDVRFRCRRPGCRQRWERFDALTGYQSDRKVA